MPHNAIKFMGLGIDLITGEPELFSTALIDTSKSALIDLFNVKAKDAYESHHLYFIDFNPKALSQFLLNQKWVPVGAICCLAALFKYYGFEATKAAMTILD